MSRATRAKSAPPVLITAGHTGQAKFAPTGPRATTTTTQLIPPQPTTTTSHHLSTTILQRQLSDTEDRLHHALAQLTAAQTTLANLQSSPRPIPRPANEKDALIKRLTQELSRTVAKNQALRSDLVVAERKLDAAFANHDEYRKLGTRALRRLLRDKAEMEDKITGLQGENRGLREALGVDDFEEEG